MAENRRSALLQRRKRKVRKQLARSERPLLSNRRGGGGLAIAKFYCGPLVPANRAQLRVREDCKVAPPARQGHA